MREGVLGILCIRGRDVDHGRRLRLRNPPIHAQAEQVIHVQVAQQYGRRMCKRDRCINESTSSVEDKARLTSLHEVTRRVSAKDGEIASGDGG